MPRTATRSVGVGTGSGPLRKVSRTDALLRRLRPTNRPDFAAPSAAAEESIATVGLEPGNADSGWHLDLLQAEKELTRRSDELAQRRQALPWVRVDKTYRFEVDEGGAALADLFRGLLWRNCGPTRSGWSGRFPGRLVRRRLQRRFQRVGQPGAAARRRRRVQLPARSRSSVSHR